MFTPIACVALRRMRPIDLVDLVKIFSRIYANERAGRAIFFAGISRAFCTRRIQAGVVAEIAFHREQILGLRHRLRQRCLAERERRTDSLRESPLPLPFFAPGRAIIEIALYGHCVAQSPQPIQVAGLISISPSGKRAIAPVGQPVRHSGSWQCMQTDGTSTLCIAGLFGLNGRSI